MGGWLPSSEDNRPYVAPNLFPAGYLTQYVGVADDVENGVVGGGNLLVLQSSQVEEVTLVVQFITKWYLAGGAASWKGAVAGDWVKFHLKAPATAGESNPGAGVFDKYQVAPGLNMFIPNATQQGDWDLDLEETLNANVPFTKVVPVPASKDTNGDYTGFFDWDPDTGVVMLNASQKGRYNLFDQVIPLHPFVQKVPLLGDSVESFTVPAIKPYLVLPHWQVILTLYNSTTKSLDLGAMVYRGIL